MKPEVTLPALLEARYGADAPQIAGQVSPVLQTLLTHKSVRRFQQSPLPAGLLERIVAAAQSAASSSNLQTWSVVALQNPDRKAQAAKLCGDQEFIRQAPLFLVFCADLARLTFVSEQANLPGGGLDYLELFLTATIDAALAAQNAAAAAESEGMGICYVGSARNNSRELSELLHLPSRVFALFGLAVGVPLSEDTTTVKPRLPQSAVLHHETYAQDALPGAISNYDETMRGFYDVQGMNIEGAWSHHSAKRVSGPESLGNRSRLRDTLRDLGFELR